MVKTSFIGIKTSQARESFDLWERFLEETNFSRIIEIGTYKWGMSLFLFLWCKTKKAQFFTYDILFFPATRVIRELGITKCFKMADVFEIEEEVAEKIKGEGTSVLFCDGGDKARELWIFSRHLKKGDYIAVHDWNTEVFEKDIPTSLSFITGDEMTRIFQYA